MPSVSLPIILYTILIALLCFQGVLAAPIVVFKSSGVQFPWNHATYGNFDVPYYTTTLTGQLATAQGIKVELSYPYPLDKYSDFSCKIYDINDLLITNCENPIQSNTSQQKIVIQYVSQVRFPVTVKILDATTTTLATYNFPGISPITMTTMPLVAFYTAGASSPNWYFQILNPHQEYTSDASNQLHLCQSGSCYSFNFSPGSIAGPFSLPAKYAADFTVHSAAPIDSNIEVPSQRFALPIPAADISGDGTPFWPFGSGSAFQSDTTPNTKSFIYRMPDVASEKPNRLQVRWSLWPATPGTSSWYAGLPKDGNSNLLATDLQFQLPNLALYTKYSMIQSVDPTSPNACYCYQPSPSPPKMCSPGDSIPFATTSIECIFLTSRAAWGSPSVLVNPDNDGDVSSDPFPLTLSYREDAGSITRVYIHKAPINTPGVASVLLSLQFDLKKNPVGLRRMMGVMSVSGVPYVVEAFSVTLTGFIPPQPLYFSTTGEDMVHCQVNDFAQGAGARTMVGLPAYGSTSWTSGTCRYYRKVNSSPSLDYAEPSLTPTYSTNASEYNFYRGLDLFGMPARAVSGVDYFFTKPAFIPFPIPTTQSASLMVPLSSWNDRFTFTSQMKTIPSTVDQSSNSIWYNSFTHVQQGISLQHSFHQFSSGPKFHVNGDVDTSSSDVLSKNSSSLCQGVLLCQFQTSAETDKPLITSYQLAETLGDEQKDPIAFQVSQSVFGSNSDSVAYSPYVFLYKPNIPTEKRLLRLHNPTTGYIEIIHSTVQTNTPVELLNGSNFYLLLCGAQDDIILGSAATVLVKASYSEIDEVTLWSTTAYTKDYCAKISTANVLSFGPGIKSNVPFYFTIAMAAKGTSTFQNYYSQLYTALPPVNSFVVVASNQGASQGDFSPPNSSTIKVIDLPSALVANIEIKNTPLTTQTSPNGFIVELAVPSWVIFTSASCTVRSRKSSGPDLWSATVQMEIDHRVAVTSSSPARVVLRNKTPDGSTSPYPFPASAYSDEIWRADCTFGLDVEAFDPTVRIPDINTPTPLEIFFGIESNIIGTNLLYHSNSVPPMYFLHPRNTVLCEAMGKCVANDVPVTTIVKDTPPPITPTLPKTTNSLTGHCEIVMTNKATMQMYNEAAHARMCSIPIAGVLTSRTVNQNDVDVGLTLPTDKTDYSLCDCRCKGYWVDDIDNNDYKKCSKCSVPNCPALFTPNSECTACECSTPQCKRFTTNVFGMIYFKPQVLRYLVDLKTDSTTAQFNSAVLDKAALSTYLGNPIPSYKTVYFDLMSKFSTYLTAQIRTATISTVHKSTVQNVLITPLVEGSFTAWKITITFTNGEKKALVDMAPLYGLPAIEQKVSELFNTFITTQFSLTSSTTSTTFPSFVSTAPVSAQSPTQLPLFTSDVIKVGCVNRAAYDNTSVTPIKADMLHECPLPNQYVAVKNNLTKADSLNPLWSKCDTDNTISFINYESLLSPTVTTTALKVRQLYPYCFDFAGVNVGLEFNIPCGYNPSTDLLYATTTSTLMLPSYATAVLGSFVLSSDTDKVIQDRIAALRSFPSPRFPSFPITTVVLCPTVDSSSTPLITPTKRCSVDTYGDECQFKSIIAETSMTSSPTTVSPQSYAHVQWDFMGDNTQELTIVLYSTQKKNDGQGYFVWSQLLTTVPVASLYASAQVPTLDQSKLFEMVYDAIAHGNNIDLVNIYSSSTNIAIKGYFTRGAQQLINLDEKQIVEQFTFDLPMLCTEFNVSCSHTQSQYCTQNDGRCKCKPGYYDVNPTQERSSSYIIDPNDSSKNIDGNDLTCLPLCQNDGEWDNETSTCKCQDGYNGEYCQVKDDCQVNKASLCQGDNGYIAFTLLTEDSEATTPSCQDTQCQCYGHWINQSDAPNTDDLIKKKPKDYVARNNGCSICSLKPINSQFYSPEQLVIINDYYSSNTELSTQYYGNEDTMYTQTYQPTTTTLNTDEQLHPLTQQRCYITGTQPTTYDDGNCIKCQCKRGYGGDYCQLHIAYVNMTYTPTDGNNYVYDKTTEVLLFNKLTEELSLSMNNFDQTQMFVIQHNRDYHWVEIGLYTGLDFFTRNAEYNASIQQQQQQQSEGYLMSTQQTTIPTGFNPTLLPTNLDSLYTQWDDLTTNFPTTPVKNQDTNDYLGPIDAPAVIQDPACFEQEIIGCSGTDERPKRASGHALLIGLVVGLVSAALLFILLVLILLWCRKNERGFWKSQKEQERDELSNFVPTKTNTFKGSTAAPSMTVGTSSMVPLGSTTTGGVEMQSTTNNTTTTSAVQSASNHTEVKDPTLPASYKAYKDAKGQIFYVNSETMTTSWNHPNEAAHNDTPAGASPGGDDYGAGW